MFAMSRSSAYQQNEKLPGQRLEPAHMPRLLPSVTEHNGREAHRDTDQGLSRARRISRSDTLVPVPIYRGGRYNTSTDVSSDTSAQMSEAGTADMKLEVVTVPVSDVDRAKRFYQGLGWRLDADLTAGDAFRVVQFTPTHPVCSVSFGKGTGPACSTRRPSITTRTEAHAPHDWWDWYAAYMRAREHARGGLRGCSPLHGRSKARHGPVSSSRGPRDHLSGTMLEPRSLPSPYERTG